MHPTTGEQQQTVVYAGWAASILAAVETDNRQQPWKKSVGSIEANQFGVSGPDWATFKTKFAPGGN